MYITEDDGTLLLHGLQYTLAYALDTHTHRWNLVATLPIHGELKVADFVKEIMEERRVLDSLVF